MSEKLKNAEYELACTLDSLAHLQKSVEFLNFSYCSSEEHRNPGDDFTDVVYALGSLQMHAGTIDTLIERRIAKLKRKIRKIKRKAKLSQGKEAPDDK